MLCSQLKKKNEGSLTKMIIHNVIMNKNDSLVFYYEIFYTPKYENHYRPQKQDIILRYL